MAKMGCLIRPVTINECPWLRKDLIEGDVVYEFSGHTYGCIGSGIAVFDKPGGPWYEIPHDAVKWDDA